MSTAIDGDFLIVAGADDLLAREIEKLGHAKGRRPVRLTLEDSARLFSVHVSNGTAQVTPDVPMFVRAQAPPALAGDFDTSFLFTECFAAFWAAASLASAPVINRPGVYGLAGSLSTSASLTELRGGLQTSRTEIFSDTLPAPRAGIEGWATQSIQTHKTAAWPAEPEGGGPYRARAVPSEPAYEVVVVLRPSAWRCTVVALDDLHLEERSVELVERLGLQFAAVVWNVETDPRAASVARVEAFPRMEHAQFVWPALGPALLRALSA